MSQRPKRKRPAATAISKPFPWGLVAGSTLLAAALIGIVVYAALNQGSGFEDPLEKADKQFPGLTIQTDLARSHVPGAVDYPSPVPMGGDHNAVPQQCAVYDAEVPAEHAVHSLEHGAMWITYRPDLPADQVEALSEQVDGNPYGLMSVSSDQDSPVLLTAWGRQLAIDSGSDERVGRFVDTYANGPQSLERGASCSGNTSTGSDPAGAPAAPPSPAASAPASPAPSAPASPAPASPAPPSPAASAPASPAASPTG